MGWRFHATTLPALCAVLIALAGCGDGQPTKIKVTGKLLRNGQPYTVSKETYVTLSFAPEGEKALQTYPAKFHQDTGVYVVELPAGKYRVKCNVVDGKNQLIPTAPPKNVDLSKAQELDIDITPP